MSEEKQSLSPRSESRGGSKSRKPKAAPKKKKTSTLRKVVLSFMVVVMGALFITAGALMYLVFKTNDAIETIGYDDPTATEVPVAESVKAKPVAFALLGIDSRANAGGLNTDVMMVAAFNPVTKKATVVTIPRDTYIDVEGYRGRKANAFYADFYMVASRDKGMSREEAALDGKRVVREVLGKLFGIDIKYAGMINFKGFSDVVDVLGGVNVNVDMRMKYTDSHDGTDIDLHPGERVLDGKEALDFVRYRQSNDGRNMSSDFDRNRRQNEVLAAIVDKLMSLGGISKINSVIDTVSDNVSMDMPSQEIRRMLEQYLSVRSDDITFIALEGVWRNPYVHANQDSLEQARAALQEKMAQ